MKRSPHTATARHDLAAEIYHLKEPQKLASELFKMKARVDLAHVPYHGSPQAMTDLLSGRMHVMFDLLPTSIESRQREGGFSVTRNRNLTPVMIRLRLQMLRPLSMRYS